MPTYRKNIYLDHAATTPLRPEVYQAMKPYLTIRYGNPSSAYQLGEQSANAVAHAREQIANVLHASPEEIYFTAGGTESDNWALKGVVEYQKFKRRREQCHIITSCVEHPAVLNSAKNLETKGITVDYLTVNREGMVSVEEAVQRIRPATVLLSVMYANNEIGTIEPISELGEMAASYGVVMHTDAVQAFGQVPIDVKKEQIGLLSASSHKLGGPKGVGFLYVSKDCPLAPFINGGGQEKGMRSGTENVAGIVGLGAASEFAGKTMHQKMEYTKKMRNYFWESVQKEIPSAWLNGASVQENRLPGNLNITIPGMNAAEVVARLDERMIQCSTASACAANHTHPSHVLQSIGLGDDDARATLRFTLGEENTVKEIQYTVYQLKTIIAEQSH